jgi:serine/threonine-protein kinase
MDASELVGERVAARYIIEAVLGTGGMANVYRAFDTNLQRHVAIKIFTEPLAAIKRRFLAEARSLARLNHPGIVSVYDGGEDGDRSFIVMEIADGEDLRAWRDRGATFGFLIAAVASILDALAFAHERDILHRDVKPSNIFVNADGRVKLMDFGLSRRISDLSAGTQAGEIVGTVAYLPPERFLGKPSDARGDLYSIGIVLYELITGFAPFRSDCDDLVAIIFAHLNERPVPPRQAGAAIDDELERVVMRLLEKDPSARFASAALVRDALLDYLARHPDVAAAAPGAPNVGG